MRLQRGAGLAGLAGIRPRAEIDGLIVLRPLLGWRRAELAEIVAAAGLTAVDDPTNSDERYDRARLRRRLGGDGLARRPRAGPQRRRARRGGGGARLDGRTADRGTDRERAGRPHVRRVGPAAGAPPPRPRPPAGSARPRRSAARRRRPAPARRARGGRDRDSGRRAMRGRPVWRLRPGAAASRRPSRASPSPGPRPAPAGSASGPPSRTAPARPLIPSAPARRSAMIARVAIAPPIEAAVNGLPFGASTAEAPAFRQRSASRMSPVTTTAPGPARPAIQSSAASNASDDGHPLDQGMLRHAQPLIADDADRHVVPPGDLVDLLLHRAGVGIDEDDDLGRAHRRTIVAKSPRSSLRRGGGLICRAACPTGREGVIMAGAEPAPRCRS